MTWHEVDACLRGISYRERAGWEQARMIGYITAQAHSSKDIKYTDIMKFDWDKEIDCNVKSLDIMSIENLKERMRLRELELNNN